MTQPHPALVGAVLDLEVGPIAHGGHCVARHDGRVVFVRHAIPGERVRARVTEGHEGSRFLRADAVEILSPSPERVEPPCPYAGPGRCGGCDFQHVRLSAQRDLLADVVAEQFRRLAGVEVRPLVEPVPGDQDGLRWRTRVRYAATPDRRPGLRKHRSHEVLAVDDCRIARRDLPDVTSALARGADSAEAVVTSTGDTAVVTDGSGPRVTERAAGRTWRLRAADFWQVHPGATDALVSAVLEGAALRPGERCWDLYAGVGLFAGPLAAAVGETGSVLAVEGHRRSARAGRDNLADLPQVRFEGLPVERFVTGARGGETVDAVVLDPPRSGAGRAVVEALVARRPRVVVYVACDPAALARDVATLGTGGYRLDGLRCFDIFPMTHHVECVAVCRPVDAGEGAGLR